MRPETAAEAIAYCEHKRLYPEHEPPYCCAFWGPDFANASELVADLEAIGWDPPRPTVSLPASVPKGLGPERIEDMSDRCRSVYEVLSLYGPMTDEALNERYGLAALTSPQLYPPQSPESPRKRRTELALAGLVYWTGEKRQTKSGSLAKVWAVRGAQAVAA